MSTPDADELAYIRKIDALRAEAVAKERERIANYIRRKMTVYSTLDDCDLENSVRNGEE